MAVAKKIALRTGICDKYQNGMILPISFIERKIHATSMRGSKKVCQRGSNFDNVFGTRDLFNISYSRELYLFSKFLHFVEIVRVKMAVCFEMIVSET